MKREERVARARVLLVALTLAIAAPAAAQTSGGNMGADSPDEQPTAATAGGTSLAQTSYSAATYNLLPRSTRDDIDLYAWLKTFSEKDFDVPQGTSTKITYTPAGATVRELYGAYYGLQSARAYTDLLRYPSGAFMLNNGAGEGIEGVSGGVRILRSNGRSESGYGTLLEGTFFYTFGGKGIDNPFYRHQGLANRLATQAVALIMQSKRQADIGLYGSYPEYVGMVVMQSLTAFNAAKNDAKGMTPALREAFYRTAESLMLTWESRGGPKDANTNMDTKTFYGLALLYKGAKEEGLSSVARNARELAAFGLLGSRSANDAGLAQGHLGRVIFHPAGYIGERSMPETSYNGISLYYLAEAALVVRGEAGWEWLWDKNGVVDRMAKFKTYQIFRDPSGRFNGPSGYAIRTASPYAGDQSNSPGRDMAVAMLSDYGKAHFQKRNASTALTLLETPSLAEVEESIRKSLAKDYGERAFTRIPAVYEYIYQASTRWWAERIGTVATTYYDPSFYNEVSTLIGRNDPTLELPSLRAGLAYNEVFGPDGANPEFWAVKDVDAKGGEFAAFIEAFTRNPSATNGYSSWRGGGTVQSFWTPEAGLVINTRGSKHDKDSQKWPAVNTWATHHLWGKMGDGATRFSSAQRDSRITSYTWDNVAAPTRFTATNTPDRSSGSYSGNVSYSRTIAKIAGGLEVTTSLRTDARDTFTELWESLPIYKRFNNNDVNTTIEYTTSALGGGSLSWKTLGQARVSGITAIRLGRDYGTKAYVYIVPKTPVAAKLESEWQADYQMSDFFQQLAIDLHGNPGKAQKISEASVTYAITTVEPSGSGDSGPRPLTIQLQPGWNLISRYLGPAEASFETLLADVRAKVVLVKNGAGQVYAPKYGINDIGSWLVQEGYQVLVEEPCSITLSGTPVTPKPVALKKGWNLIAYPYATAAGASEVFGSILSDLELVEDGAGGRYVPSGANTIGNLQPGQGYRVYVKRDVTLSFPTTL